MLSQYFTYPKVHTILWCACMFALGIIAQSVNLIASVYYLFALAILLLLYLSCKYKESVYVLYAISSIGGAMSYQQQINLHTELAQLIGNNEFEVIGCVTNITVLKNQKNRQCVTVNTEQIKLSALVGSWIPTKKTIQLYTTQKTNLMVADRIHVKNLKIKPAQNDSYSLYLIKEQIDASIFAPNLEYTLLQRPSYSINRYIFNLRNYVLYKVKKNLAPQTYALFASIFLGNRVDSKNEMMQTKELYKIWGLSHYLARSGLHLVLVVFVWDLLLNLIPISFLLKQIALVILTIFYCFCSWSSISFVRAFLVFALYKVCLIAKLPINVLHILSIVTLGVLIVNPAQLFFLDFQLSFGLTYALAWFNHVYKLKEG